MEESTTASGKNEQGSRMGSADMDKDAGSRHPSIDTEPRTLNEMKMELALVIAQKIYFERPSEDFTKDAVDEAIRENAPAEDAGDTNSLEKDLNDLVQRAGGVVDTNFMQSKASVPSEAPPTPPPSPAT